MHGFFLLGGAARLSGVVRSRIEIDFPRSPSKRVSGLGNRVRAAAMSGGVDKDP